MIDCRWDLFSPGITVFDSLWEVLLITSHISVIDTTLKEDIHFWCSFFAVFFKFFEEFYRFSERKLTNIPKQDTSNHF